MGLTNSKEILKRAFKEGYAVPQFNINNLEWAKAILHACKEMRSPVILGVSEGAAKYMGGTNVVSGMIKGMIKDLKIDIPVILHLDHGSSYEACEKAIHSGYTSVMIDKSHQPLEENLRETKRVVELASKHNVSVEAEIGTIGGEEDGVAGSIMYASVDECKEMKKTGINSLAAAVGTAHGFYVGEPNINTDLILKLKHEIDLPLVLHGGSGIPNDTIRKSIAAGASKVNVNTEIQAAFTFKLKEYFDTDKYKDVFDPRKVLAQACQAMIDKCKEKITLFGSNDRY